MTEWIETSSGTRISSTAKLHGKQFIKIKGNLLVGPNVVIHGDAELLSPESSVVSIGKYCCIGAGSTISPPVVKVQNDHKLYGPVKLGSYVIIGDNCHVSSAAIGNRVVVESNCILHQLSIIYDCCIIREGCQIPAKTVIPPFSEVKGVPGVDFTIKPLASGYKKTIELEAKELQILGLNA